MQIRPEKAADATAVAAVHAAAFGAPDRVPGLVAALREAPAALPPAGFVAVEDGDVVGHVLLSAVRVDAPRRLVDAYTLSPLGVRPDRQRAGIGTALVAYALAAADAAGVPLVFLEGDPGFYGVRGFEPATPAGFRSPSLRIPAAAFQVARLSSYEPWMTGTMVYSEPFWVYDCVGLRTVA